MAESAPPRALVVDDDARVRPFLCAALEAAGFRVTATASGEEALRLAAARPDLIVLDVELPDLSGREVCRRLKASPEAATVPVLMLSGVFVDPSDRSQALEDGSDAYLTKPVTVRELVATARALLRLVQAERRSREYETTEVALRRRVAQSKFMLEVARAITSSLDVQPLLERIVDQASRLLAAPRVSLALLERTEPTPVIRFAAARGLSRRFTEELRPLHWRDGTTPMAIHERRPVWSADLLLDPQFELAPATRAMVEAEGYRAVLSVPLLARDRPLGALALYRDQPGPFSEDEIDVMQLFAAQAAIAVENAALYRRAQSRAEKLTTLSTLTRLITSAASSHEVFGAVAEAAARLLDARSSQVWVDDPAAGVLRAQGSYTVDPIITAGLRRYTEIPHGHGVTAEVYVSRAPVFISDLRAEPRWLNPELVRQTDVRFYAGIPLVAGDHVVGVLSLLFEERAEFTEEEKELARMLADQAAIAIRQAQLYAEADRRRQDAERMAANLERSQSSLVKTERLRALGEMAAGVAHDFNNLLSVILGRAELMLRRVREADTTRDLEAVRRAAQDGADTVRRIQEFTRTRRTRAFERVDLLGVAREVVELTRPRWELEAQAKGVTYEFAVEGDAPPVAGRPEEIREVLTNLLTNAVDAMPSGGRCRVRLDTDGAWAVIAVTDTGVGMPDEMRLRVFEPFFTSKGPRGTGLGLAVSWGIVTRHGGTIEVESTPGEGTTFRLRLPIPVTLPEVVVGMPVTAAPRPARVLLIEDEPEVQAVLADILRDAGYTVAVAKDGIEGIEHCERDTVDLVLSDISMPGISGWDVAARLRARHPHLPIGFVTGWGDQLDPERLASSGVDFVVAKPFQAHDILRHVAQAVMRPARAPR
jgi:DNA-binding response OmpR family regulator/nitrogen-specific signal transduction histidine kinase